VGGVNLEPIEKEIISVIILETENIFAASNSPDLRKTLKLLLLAAEITLAALKQLLAGYLCSNHLCISLWHNKMTNKNTPVGS
jgi:hypothetical protein